MSSRACLWSPFLALLVAVAACSREDVATSNGDAAARAQFDAGREPDAADSGVLVLASDLDANDVSILWPVPRTGELPAGYLKLLPRDGERGPGIPQEALDAIPKLHADLPQAQVLQSAAIVALRADPCALSTAGSCVRELRLSVEPLSPGLADTAVHLVYELDERRFEELLADLLLLRAHSPAPTTGVLRVHPGLEAGGVDSSFAHELHDVVLKYATAGALVRVTANAFAFDNWSFARFDRASGWTNVAIPGLSAGDTTQAWLRQAEQDSLEDPTGTISPAPAKSFAALLSATSLDVGVDAPAVLAARDAILDFEHPERANAASNDCASCHLADAAHRWAERRGVSFDTAGRYEPPQGTSVDVVATPEVDGNLSNTIAFGWHRVKNTIAVPSVSARVAAETAEVLRQLRAR